jgi:hypothetical protein
VKIDVHIDRLILEGWPLTRQQGALVQAAVERELARLLATGRLSGEARMGGAVPQVNAGSFELREVNDPSRLGYQIAQSVYGGITPAATNAASAMSHRHGERTEDAIAGREGAPGRAEGTRS